MNIDWKNMEALEISKALNISEGYARRLQLRRHPELSRFRCPEPDWSKVDLTKTVTALVKELKVPAYRIVAAKTAAGHPPQPYRGGGKIRLKVNWARVNWRKPAAQLAAELGVSLSTVYTHRPKQG